MGLQPKADLGPAVRFGCLWTPGSVFAAHECGNLLQLLLKSRLTPFLELGEEGGVKGLLAQ